jgi:hypothetical protein
MFPTAQRYLQQHREVSSSMPMFPALYQVPSKQKYSSTEIDLTLNHVLQASATHQCFSNVATTDLALNRVLQSSATHERFRTSATTDLALDLILQPTRHVSSVNNISSSNSTGVAE